MKLLIVEPEATGHRMALYVRLIVQSARQRGWEIALLTTGSALEHPAFQIALQNYLDDHEIHLMPETTKSRQRNLFQLLLQQLRYFWAFRAGYRTISKSMSPDHIVVPSLDYLDKVMALAGSPFGTTCFSGLLMSVKFHRKAMRIGPESRSDRLYAALFHRLLAIKNLRNLIVVDEAFADFIQRCSKQSTDKVQFIPEAADQVQVVSKSDARERFAIPSGSFVVLVYGSLTRRKGIVELLQAVNDSQSDDVVVLLVGTPDKEMKEVLSQPFVDELRRRGQLAEALGFQDRPGEGRAFGAADVVWLGYVGRFFGSSGVLYQAGSVGLPVITPANGLLAWLNGRYEIGPACNPEDSSAVNQTILALKRKPEIARRFGTNNRQLARQHLGNRFGEEICRAIDEKLSS